MAENMRPLTVEDIMNSTFGETSSEIRATYKKTVLIKQYETEVVELETKLKVEKALSGAERMFISAALQVQLEYTAYCQLAFKGLVTNSQLLSRKKELEQGLTAIKVKAEKVLGRSLDEYVAVKLE